MPQPTVTAEDIQATVQWWVATAPKHQSTFLERGAPNELQAERAVEQMIARNVRDRRLLLEQHTRGKLSEPDFETAMALMTKRETLAVKALAFGGINRIPFAELADSE